MKNSNLKLIIGGVDVSDLAERENFSVNKIWNIADSFKGYDGQDIIMRNGWNYKIRAELKNIPDNVMSALTNALDNDTFSVTFTDPHSQSDDRCTTDNFTRSESTGGTVVCELDDGLRWDIVLDITSEFHSGSESGGGL